MTKRFSIALAILCLAISTMLACGDNGGDADPTGSITVQGAMQKGPLLTGSTLTVSMMRKGGVPTGVNYNTTTTSDLGEFRVVSQKTGPCELVGQGFYFNEIANTLSGAPITLRAIYEIASTGTQNAYLNAFTHMSSGLAMKLLQEKNPQTKAPYNVDDAVAYAETKLFEALGIAHPSGALEANGTAMDLMGADSPDNQYIMAVSCILAKAAQMRAADPDEVDARLQELLNDIRSQLENSETISSKYVEFLRTGEASFDPISDCVDNLKAYLADKTGTTPSLPDPNQAADFDRDGVVNGADEDIDGDGVLNDDDGDPYDPNDLSGSDLDNDGTPNAYDDDIDGDGVLNEDDLDPYDPNDISGSDLDGDGIPNAYDDDIDGDGVLNDDDGDPYDPNDLSGSDLDNDGTPNAYDDDIDGDGVLNEDDLYPYDPTGGVPHSLEIASSGEQSGTVGKALAAPLVVRVVEQGGQPIRNVELEFTAAAAGGTPGTVTPEKVSSDPNGEAEVTFTLGTLTGETVQWVEVTVPDFPSVATLSIPVSAKPAEPASIEIVSGNDQAAAYGQPLSKSLVVVLEDQYGNLAWGYPVTWSSSTGGVVSPNPSLADETGVATGSATLGSAPRMPNQVFTANAGEVSVDFHATATGPVIDELKPWKVWPGYPDPSAADPSMLKVEVTIHGAGLDPDALVVWDKGQTEEELITPVSVTPTMIVFRCTGDNLTASGTHSVTVRNPGPSHSASVDFTVGYMLPDTGQTWCTDASHQQVDCATILPGDPLYGQDGHYLQLSQGQHFFVDHEDGTVTDAITGLMWERAPSAEQMEQSEHFTYCDASTTGGYNDWRVPALLELSTLVEAGSIDPSIDPTAFPLTPSKTFKSSSHIDTDDDVWQVDFDAGDVNGRNFSGAGYVRCVRLGPLKPARYDSLVLSGDRVAMDRQNDLLWQGCTAGYSGSNCDAISDMTYSWPQALSYCEGLSWGGYDDWRLPNRNELLSIFDFENSHMSDSTINPVVFPSTPSDWFWSSSVYADDTNAAWYVYFNMSGGVHPDDKTNPQSVRCVRGGP